MSAKGQRGVLWKDLGDVRGLLYGLAIVSVMVFHFTATVVSWGSDDRELYRACDTFGTVVGSVGVDVFAILSGYGIYHSLRKSFDLRRYYGRRAKRVVMPYLIAGLAFWAAKDLYVLGLAPDAVARDLFWVSFVTDGVVTVWYVPFIVVMYAVAPLIFQVVDHGFPATVLAVLAAYGCASLSQDVPAVFGHIEVALTRVPAFLLGMGAGHLASRRDTIPVLILLVLPVGFALKFSSYVPTALEARFINTLYGAAIIDVVVLVQWAVRRLTTRAGTDASEPAAERSARRKPPLRMLVDGLGAMSYELYLTHVMVRNIVGTSGGNIADPGVYAACMAASLPLAWLLTKLQLIRLRS